MKQIFFIFIVYAAAFGNAWAQTNTKLDADQPIDITADELEVLQEQQQAIFRGNVLAKQGGISMKAAQMKVFYTQNSSNAQGIDKIIADGGVFFASAQETAQGNSATYDVPGEQILMQGDVTLTREKNVLKGNRLIYNLKTGRSVLSAQSVPGEKNGSGGRVRGLFVPNNKTGK